MTWIIFLILFFCAQGFILWCCLASGADALEQARSDEEQLQYLAEWTKQHADKTNAKHTK